MDWDEDLLAHAVLQPPQHWGWLVGVKVKIGQIPHLYRPHPGGTENYVHRLKNSLEGKGHEVTVYTTDLSIRGATSREKDTFYCKTDFVLLRNPFSLELARKLKKTSDDIYHLHSPWFFSSLFGTKVLKERPKVMTVHGARIEGWGPAVSVLNNFYRPFARYILHNMQIVIALANGEREYLLHRFKLPPDRVVLIPNGIEIGEFAFNKGVANKFVEKYHLKDDSFKVLYVGRFVPQKNPDKLISAVKRLRGKNVEAILIGEDSQNYIAKLKESSDERIHILAKLRFEEIVAAYHISDLFTLPSSFEGLPTVLLEAMLCGLPVLTTPVGGIPDVVTEGTNGLFLDLPVRAEDVADKISRFINMGDSDLRRMGKANVRKVKKEYNWKGVVDRILEVYDQVLG